LPRSVMQREAGGGEMLNQKLSAIAKNLRKNSTDSERLLWRYLRLKQACGFKFRRQAPVGNYIADFVCFEKRLIIEADGGQHARRVRDDKARDEWFASQGFKVLRFWNNEVFSNIEGVLETIRKELTRAPSPTPPIKGGGKVEEKE